MNTKKKFPKSKQSLHTGIATLSLVFLGVFTALLLGELVVRLYLHLNADILPLACRRKDPILNHSLTPNTTCRFKTSEWDITYRINSLGLRDQEYSQQKPLGAYRILVLGDSFAEGYGVEESQTYQYLLEGKLNNSSSRLNEVINAGVQSYSPTLEYLYLQKYGLALDPDLIILHLDLTDFSDEQRYAAGESSLFQDTIPSVTWIPFLGQQVKWWLHQNSRLYDFSVKTLKKKLYPDLFPDQISFVPKDPFKDAFVILRDLNESEYIRLWQAITKNLLNIKQLLDEKNIKLILIMPPHGHQLSTQEWAKGRSRWQFAKDQIYSLRPQQDMQKFARENDLNYIDLIPAFQSGIGKKRLFFPIDGHLTFAGHQLVAEALFDNF